MRLDRQRDIVERGKIWKYAGDLKGSRQPQTRTAMRGQSGDVASVEHDAAAIRRNFPRQLADQRCLARTVGPDDRVNLPLFNTKTKIVGRNQAAKTLEQVGDLKQHGFCKQRCF